MKSFKETSDIDDKQQKIIIAGNGMAGAGSGYAPSKVERYVWMGVEALELFQISEINL